MSSMSTDDESTTSLMSTDDDDESTSSCSLPLSVLERAALAMAILLMTATLILIPCHHRLRKRHHIFPYNLVLSDFIGAIVFAIFESGAEIPRKVAGALIIVSTASFVESLLSIILVTGYQFITIRVDPFGALNIITPPRLVVTCVLTWGISLALSSILAVTQQNHLYIFVLSVSWTATVITGLCYIFIYRSIAKVPCDGRLTQERKEENQRVLQTFGLIFGTTVFCWICPWLDWSLVSLMGFQNECLKAAGQMMINVNWIANSIIYWWRLEEFRSMFTRWRSHRGTVDPLSLVTDLP